MNLVELQNVSLAYGRMEVIKNLSLHLAEGEVLGLFGHNGAGKTTTMKMILGLLAPGSGHVQVFGNTPDHTEVRKRLGYLPENVMFYPQLSGEETLTYFARLKGAAHHQIGELLEKVGLTHAATRKVKTYSKGMRQRLGLAQALLANPRLLLLDEPTVGLDPVATQELYQLLNELRQNGTGIILCSHVLPGVEPYISRAAILAGGQLQAVGTLSELRRQVALPTRIRHGSLSEPEHWQTRLSGLGFDSRCIGRDALEVLTHNGARRELLNTLINSSEAADLEVSPPSLDDLYRHFAVVPAQEKSQ